MDQQILMHPDQQFFTQQQRDEFCRPRAVDWKSREHFVEGGSANAGAGEGVFDRLSRQSFLFTHRHATAGDVEMIVGDLQFFCF